MSISQEEFINRSNKIHNYIYDYSKSIFSGTKQKVIIICPTHGEFLQRAGKHMSGTKCPVCTNHIKLDKQEFLKRIKNTNYDYSKSVVVDSTTKIEIICSIHGSFYQSPSKHLAGQHCPRCARITSANKQKMTLQEFIDKSNVVHDNYYDYSKSIYETAKKKISIICPKHGTFKQIPDNHLNGHGCPKCHYNVSKLETKWLDSLNIKERNISLYIEDKRINVDGYDPMTNTIYEFYGDYWHGNLNKFNADDVNEHNGKTFKQLYDDTILREELIKSAGYNLVSIWEYQY